MTTSENIRSYELLPFSRQEGWRRMRTRHGLELYHYPTDLARQLWYYVFAMGRSEVPPGKAIRQICQDRYVLHWVQKGTIRLVIDNRKFDVTPGEAFLIDLGSEPCHGPKGSRSTRSYWVSFNGKDMPRYMTALGAGNNPVFRGLAPDRIRNLLAQLYRLTRRQDYAYEARVSAVIETLLAELYASRPLQVARVTLGTETYLLSDPIRRAIDWIIRYYDCPVGIGQLAEQIGFSRSHFSRVFHRETGITPGEWLNRYRIDQSRRLLETGEKTIAEIARAVGIPDQNYFARLFRRFIGCSPRGYRQQNILKNSGQEYDRRSQTP